MKEKGVKRIIDANLNRACEGLRILEDIVRFSFNDKELTLRIKKERHRLREIFAQEELESVIERDVDGDVGSGPSRLEEKRGNLFDIVIHNVKRVEESLRSLEEMSKLFSVKKAQRMKLMRFKIYSIDKSVKELCYSKRGFRRKGIYIVLPDRRKRELLGIVKAIVDAPVSAIQLRSKSLTSLELIEVARSIRKITAKKDISFIVNDRVDIALAVNADGVHIGQDDIPLKDARKLAGYLFTIGVSTHSIDEAKKAEREGADYVAFGSIFRTASKPNPIVLGIGRLKKLKNEVNLPIVAIGGITDKNIKEVSSAGADYTAVMSYVSDAKDPGAAVRKLHSKFQKAKKGR